MESHLKDILHLYLGCECDLTKDDNFHFPHSVKLDAALLGNFLLLPESYRVKPLLRPLSCMSEEECITLVKLSEGEQYGDNLHKRIYNCYKNTRWQTVVSWGETAREKNIPANKTHFSPAEFTYLLSIGIDLFNLIENGFAIDKTSHNGKQ